MKINRRTFTNRLLSGLVMLAASGSALFISGCNVLNDILNWVPVGESALNSILAILSGNGVLITPAIQAIINLVEAGFTALTAAIKEYQSTTPPPQGALAKIQTAFKDIVDNFSTFLKALNISGGLLGIITGLAQVVLSTIAAFMNQLPAATNTKTLTAKVGSHSIIVTPKKRNVSGFKRDFNQVLKGAGADVKVPEKAYL